MTIQFRIIIQALKRAHYVQHADSFVALDGLLYVIMVSDEGTYVWLRLWPIVTALGAVHKFP